MSYVEKVCGGPDVIRTPYDEEGDSRDRCKLCAFRMDHNRCELARCYTTEPKYFYYKLVENDAA